MSNVTFQKTYDGGWVKKICQRNYGTREADTFLYTPTGKKLRSTLDLYKYISEHPQYWQTFDPYEINVEKQTERLIKPIPGTQKLINFLEYVNSGMSALEALEKTKTVPKPTRAPPTNNGEGLKINKAFRRKDYSKTSNHQHRPMMGPKSVMKRLKYQNTPLRRLSREVVVKLEQHFFENRVAPTDEQMTIWARKYQVDFETVKKYFRLQWKAKLNYEYMESKENEFSDSYRTRPIKNFEAQVIDTEESLTQVLQDEEYVIEIC